jgi:hypothetical protein
MIILKTLDTFPKLLLLFHVFGNACFPDKLINAFHKDSHEIVKLHLIHVVFLLSFYYLPLLWVHSNGFSCYELRILNSSTMGMWN